MMRRGMLMPMLPLILMMVQVQAQVQLLYPIFECLERDPALPLM